MWGGFEQCDDGNAASGDGCSSLCQLEPNYSCELLGVACQLVVCGDAQQHSYLRSDGSYAYEACDDGNATSGDGCDAACSVESGWICEQPGTACRRPVCGDSRQDAWFVADPTQGGGVGGGSSGGTYYYEECDDGNAASGDGCTSTCTIEAGWICSMPGEACHEPECGDGIIDYIANGGSGGGDSGGSGSGGSAGGSAGPQGSFEGCDDGNTAPGDGCDATCSVEVGWNCDPWVGPCHRTVCGDGLTDYPAEECDDANTTPNDGCTSCRWDNQGSGGSGGGSSGGFSGGGGSFGGG